MNPIISVVLPCRNEKETIGQCIQKIQKVARNANLDIEIVISDSSEDGSNNIAKEWGAVIVKHDTEGYGFALKEGIKNAKGKIIVFADADDTYCFDDIPKLLKNLEGADIVMGSRLQGKIEKGAMPLLHRFLGTPLFNILLRVIFGIKVSDSQSGYRAMRKETFLKLDLKTNGMEFATEMLIKAKKLNLKIKEIPTDYFQRKGTSKLRRYRDGWAHLKYILLQAPFAFYSTFGFFFFAIGIFSLVFLNFTSLHIPNIFNSATVKILFPIVGVQFLFFGLFAKTYLLTHFEENNTFIKKIYSIFKLKTAISVGALLIFIPLFLKITGIEYGIFEPLLISTIIGVQIIFNSIILAILSIK